MKIFYDHQYGKIETQNLQISNIYASDVSTQEYSLILEQGFLQIKEDLWFNCRSTRVVPYLINQKFNFEVNLVKENLDIEKYLKIYNQFLLNKKFNPIKEDQLFLKNDCVLEYYQHNNLVGFSKIRDYQESVELNLHCNLLPSSEFSYSTLLFEIDFYKDKKYIYLGPGYEKSSIYKSKLDNFEWFNGQSWSSDRKLYSKLCLRDSSLQVTTLS